MKSSKKKKKRSHVFANSLIAFSLVFLGMFVVFVSIPVNSAERYYTPLVTYQSETTQIASSSNASTASSYSLPAKKSDKKVDKYDAIAAAQDIVKEGMWNPKSAKFSWDANEYGITEHDGIWYVQGYVYGTNAYGAEVKSEWLTVFQLEITGDKFRIYNYSLSWF